MKKVLVTGSHGFTGHYLCNVLAQNGYKTIGLVVNNPGPNDIVANLLDKKTLFNIFSQHHFHFVIHLAGISFAVHTDLLEFYRVNVIGTLNLLEAIGATQNNLEMVLLASSGNVYGNPTNEFKMAESHHPKPANHYAISKLAMEHAAATWSDRLPIIITRPFNYTGVGQHEKFLIPKIVAHFKNRNPVIHLGNLDISREFNDVRMIAQAYVQLLEKKHLTTPINLCTGVGYCLSKIIDICKQLTGHNIEVEVDPHLLRGSEPSILTGDPTLFKRVLPDLPQYRLEDTLRWMLAENHK